MVNLETLNTCVRDIAKIPSSQMVVMLHSSYAVVNGLFGYRALLPLLFLPGYTLYFQTVEGHFSVLEPLFHFEECNHRSGANQTTTNEVIEAHAVAQPRHDFKIHAENTRNKG